MVAQSGKCWLCKHEDQSSIPKTHIKTNNKAKATNQQTSAWQYMLVIPVLGGQSQAGACGLLNGGAAVTDFILFPLPYLSTCPALTLPLCVGLKGLCCVRTATTWSSCPH